MLFLELNIRIENVFDEEYHKEFLEIYNQQDKYMNDFVRVLTQKVQETREADLFCDCDFVMRSRKFTIYLRKKHVIVNTEKKLIPLVAFLKISWNAICF